MTYLKYDKIWDISVQAPQMYFSSFYQPNLARARGRAWGGGGGLVSIPVISLLYAIRLLKRCSCVESVMEILI